MFDKKFLEWLYNRLQYKHNENPDVDYMGKFRSIIEDYPDDKLTPNTK